jgi:NAD(P)H-dependent FMN reductase
MEEKAFIPVILGTAREGRQSEKVAQSLLSVLESRGDCQTQLVDVRDYTHGRTIPDWEENEATKPWRDIVSRADGFIIVVPEYNHGYPGELKLLLDQDLKGYADVPVVVCGVSAGVFGGARAVENLTPVLRELGMIVLSYSLYVGKVGNFEVDEKSKERVNKAIDKLLDYSKRLK